MLIRQTVVLLSFIFSLQLMASEPPNIVIILADDIGYGDISYYNEQILNRAPMVETPHIDQLARQGMWFTDAHSPTPLCAPSRYSIMTGNTFFRSQLPWGTWDTAQGNPVRKWDLTLGRVAKLAGYRTGFIGKWHLGGTFLKRGSQEVFTGTALGEASMDADFTRWIAGHPRELGFDYDFTFPTGVQGPLYLAYENSTWYPLNPASEIVYLSRETAKNRRIVRKKPGMADSAWDPTQLNQLLAEKAVNLSLIHISEPTRHICLSRMPSSA